MPEKPVPASPALHEWRRIVTVTGPVAPEEMGLTDAHNHAWIARVPGAAADAPVLDDFPTALQELAYYRQAGGRALVDCQPPFCGRDALSLARLSRESGVILVACTGFHLRRYYPPEIPLWELSSQAACDLFADELLHGTRESPGLSKSPAKVRWIFLHCACWKARRRPRARPARQ
jgi:predicted metal-dependent phosphotriesterase family hydrolase